MILINLLFIFKICRTLLDGYLWRVHVSICSIHSETETPYKWTGIFTHALFELHIQKQPQEVFCKKKVFFSQNSQENTCTRVSFLIKLQASEHLFYISPPDDCFWIFAIFVTLINRARKCKLFRLGYGIWNLEINAKLKALLNLPLFRVIFKTLKQLLRGFIPVLISMLPSKPLLLIKSFSFVFRRGPQDVLRLLD